MGHNITRLKIPAGSLEANQLAIVQAWLRIWTRDYREQIQQASPGALTAPPRCLRATKVLIRAKSGEIYPRLHAAEKIRNLPKKENSSSQYQSTLQLSRFLQAGEKSSILDCEQSLLVGSAWARERWAAKPRDARNEGGSPRRKKRDRLHSQTQWNTRRASPVSRLQSRAWSFACLGRFARRTKPSEKLWSNKALCDLW